MIPMRDSVVLVEQFRLPALLAGAAPWQIEMPAGLIDAGEKPEAVAMREMREETGLALIGDPIPIQRYLPSPGDCDESVFLFCVRVDAGAAGGVHGLPEEGEDIRTQSKPWPRSKPCSTPARSRTATPWSPSTGSCATASVCAAYGCLA